MFVLDIDLQKGWVEGNWQTVLDENEVVKYGKMFEPDGAEYKCKKCKKTLGPRVPKDKNGVCIYPGMVVRNGTSIGWVRLFAGKTGRYFIPEVQWLIAETIFGCVTMECPDHLEVIEEP